MKNQSNQVKERPIIFSGEMVKAILNGKKTMTRQVVKTQPRDECTEIATSACFGHVEYRSTSEDRQTQSILAKIKCPYGKIGDRLWVRETHHVVGGIADYEIEEIKQGLQDVKNFVSYKTDGYGNPCDGGWTTPMFMPRWASRILLEIIDIRVERLQDISEADALKEGIRNYNFEMEDSPDTYVGYTHLQKDDGKSTLYKTPAIAFERLWDTLNAKKGYPWSSNPWVWAIEFKVIEVA